MKQLGILWLGAMVLLSAQPGQASNHGPQLLGSRSGGMGGASIANVQDSGVGFLNPAGLSRIDTKVFSLSVAAYAWDAYRYRKFFVRDNPPDWDTDSSAFQISGNELRSTAVNTRPASLTYIARLGGSSRLGFSILVPHSEPRSLQGGMAVQTDADTTDADFSILRADTNYYIGPSYAIGLGSGRIKVRLGASAFYVYSETSSSFTSYALTTPRRINTFSTLESSAYTSGTSHSVLFAGGVQVDAGPLSFGVVVHTPSILLGGQFDTILTTTTQGDAQYGGRNRIVITTAEGQFESRQPLRLGVGAALELGKFTLVIDGTMIIPGDYLRFDGDSLRTDRVLGEPLSPSTQSPFAVERREQAVLNGAIGVEMEVLPRVNLRAGGFTSISSTNLANGGAIGAEAIDRYGGTLGLGIGLGAIETAITMAYIGGEGEAVGFDFGNAENVANRRLVDAYQSSVIVLISGTVNLRSFFGSSSPL